MSYARINDCTQPAGQPYKAQTLPHAQFHAVGQGGTIDQPDNEQTNDGQSDAHAQQEWPGQLKRRARVGEPLWLNQLLAYMSQRIQFAE